MHNLQYKNPNVQKQEQETRSKTQIYFYFDWGYVSVKEKTGILDQIDRLLDLIISEASTSPYFMSVCS